MVCDPDYFSGGEETTHDFSSIAWIPAPKKTGFFCTGIYNPKSTFDDHRTHRPTWIRIAHTCKNCSDFRTARTRTQCPAESQSPDHTLRVTAHLFHPVQTPSTRQRILQIWTAFASLNSSARGWCRKPLQARFAGSICFRFPIARKTLLLLQKFMPLLLHLLQIPGVQHRVAPVRQASGGRIHGAVGYCKGF